MYAEKLPSDAYCILGITDQDIYEYDGDDQVPVEYLDGCMREGPLAEVGSPFSALLAMEDHKFHEKAAFPTQR